MIQWLIADFPELDAILANESISDLEELPLAPKDHSRRSERNRDLAHYPRTPALHPKVAPRPTTLCPRL
jgi:hypothetical protein